MDCNAFESKITHAAKKYIGILVSCRHNKIYKIMDSKLTRAERHAHVKKQMESNITVAEYAKEIGVKENTFATWKASFRKEEKVGNEEPAPDSLLEEKRRLKSRLLEIDSLLMKAIADKQAIIDRLKSELE
jgi:transposase-like protein